MKKNKLFGALLVLICILFAVTGCDSAVKGSDTGYVTFDGRTDASRSLTQKDANIYKIEDLYWTYTARKIDGLYTEGESAKFDTTKGVLNPGSGSTVYVERPVKQGPATGLDAQVGPFATGDWEFNIYGYVNCVVESGVAKYKTLVYTGKTSPVNIAVTKLTGTPVVIPEVAFELTATTNVPVTGKLAFDGVKLTLPETDGLFSKTTSASTGLKEPGGTAYPDVDTVLKVRVWDVTDGANPSASNLVATSTTPVTADYKTGDVVNLYPFEIVSGMETVVVNDDYEGTRTFLFAAEYQDRYTKYASEYVAKSVGSDVYDTNLYKYDSGVYESKIYENGFAPVGEVKAFMVQFYSGAVTTVSGDINDMVDASEGGSPAKFGVAVARILKSTATTPYTDASYDYYATLADAFAAYDATSTPTRPVILLRDAGNEAVTLTKAVTVDNSACFTVRNLKLTGAFDTVFNMGSGRTYKYQGGMLSKLACDGSANTYVETSGGILDVTATGDSVIHTGSIDTLNINAVSYMLSANVSGTLTLAAGNLKIGEYVSVTNLNVTATSSAVATVKGTLTSSVGNMTAIRDGGNAKGGIFKQVVLHSNLATDTTKELYGIEGMYVELPEFLTGGASGAPMFTNGNLAFVNWNSVAAGTGTVYLDKDKVVAGSSAINVYAQWSKSFGGTIFYVDSPNGASYTFYNANGNMIEYNGVLTAEKLSTAVSYSVTGHVDGMRDRFYVYNDLTVITYGNLTHYAGGSSTCYLCVSLNQGVDDSLISVTQRYVGCGKENTRLIHALSNYNTYYACGPRSRSGGSSYSIWYLLDKWNAGGTIVGDYKNETGTGDWYVPSLEEIHKFYDFLGSFETVNSTAHRYASIGSTFYCYSSTVTVLDAPGSAGAATCDFRYINAGRDDSHTNTSLDRAANEQTVPNEPLSTALPRGTIFIRSF